MKYFRLSVEGNIEHIGEFDSLSEADEDCDAAVWILDEPTAQHWLEQLSELLTK